MAPQGRPESSRHPSHNGPRRDHHSGMAGDWATGAVDIRGLHADHPAARHRSFSAITMAVAATVDNVADSPAHARPHRSSVPQRWLNSCS
ncbi:MAG: hypothetical protein P1P93_10495 [Gammaproteobacteria bacterium]|nr:hypothetical protein [Gammaproteobacteria bacterium]